MGLYVDSSEFLGQDKIAKDKFTTSDLDLYIDEYEVEILCDLLGAKTYQEFATDFAITGVLPTAPKFQEIWNQFAIDNDCGIEKSKGIKNMLIQLIYFEYIRDSKTKNNIGGVNKNLQANSEEARFVETNIYTNYDLGITSYQAIQWLICDNPNGYDWTDYNGQHKSKNTFI